MEIKRRYDYSLSPHDTKAYPMYPVFRLKKAFVSQCKECIQRRKPVNFRGTTLIADLRSATHAQIYQKRKWVPCNGRIPVRLNDFLFPEKCSAHGSQVIYWMCHYCLAPTDNSLEVLSLSLFLFKAFSYLLFYVAHYNFTAVNCQHGFFIFFQLQSKLLTNSHSCGLWALEKSF